MVSPRPEDAYRVRRPLNWALLAGGMLAALVILVALVGPSLAPQDPLKNSFIGRVGTRFIRPPYPPGAVEGFPLGSDESGRDVLSRLLWAVQPTMTLVLVVAALRLSLGLAVGLLSGWNTGRLGRFLDNLISGALSIPVLMVALCVVAALAQRWGVWAFILGLSLTGWAEAARLVQDQARMVKSQPFVEAAEAMGAAGGQVVLSHVLPQVLPLIWIQLAFEISATLMAVAALGFLGYFVNAVWVPGESDFVGIRASGAPELSQMLGGAVHSQPWTAMYAGSCVFIIVLTFNLLGEGLRRSLAEGRRAQSKIVLGAGSWVEERIYLAMAEWRRLATIGSVFIVLALGVLGGGWLLWKAQHSTLAVSQIQVPGGYIWASQLRDAQGTRWSPLAGPRQPELAWSVKAESKLSNGPVIDASGNLYLTSYQGKLFSYDSAGELRWQVDLPDEPVGWPALSQDGLVVVTGKMGDCFAYTFEGVAVWQYTADPSDDAQSGPVVGTNGLIYFVTQNFMVALTPTGERSWQINLPTYSFSSPLPRLSPDGKVLFFEDFVIDAETGAIEFRATPEPMDRYMVGADGKSYLRSSSAVMIWQPTETGAVMIAGATLDPNVMASGYRFPFDAGASPSGDFWLLYSSPYEYDRVIWLDSTGQNPQIIDFPYKGGSLIGIDAQGIGYFCGYQPRVPFECRAVQLNTRSILWKQTLDVEGSPVGGALSAGRLYIVSSSGVLYAIGK